MKFRRFLSSLLFAAGCMLVFVGLLAVCLPTIDNHQLQLVLASFQMDAENAAVQAINRFMSFSLQQNWRMIFLGTLIAIAGCGLLLHFTPKQKSSLKQEPFQQYSPISQKANPYACIRRYPEIPQAQAAFSASPVRTSLKNTGGPSSRVFHPDEPSPPYFSPRFSAETNAVQAETGARSPSGSRILIRTPSPSDEN